MTLPQNVADALSRVQMMADPYSEWADIDIADWHTIRAHLMSQEPEIERLNAECRQHLRQAMENGCAANLAESRLAAANALLREAIEWNWLDEDAPQQAGVNADTPSVMDALYLKIQTHLQGAGHE